MTKAFMDIVSGCCIHFEFYNRGQIDGICGPLENIKWIQEHVHVATYIYTTDPCTHTYMYTTHEHLAECQ